MTTTIAWKNIWRNHKRSLVVITAVTLGIISGLLLIGILEGWSKQRLQDAIYNEVSHIQIHQADFINNEEINLTVLHPERLIRMIDSLPGITGWVKRTRIVAMTTTPWAASGANLYGIYPEAEKQVSHIHQKIVHSGGRYLKSENPSDMLISDKTAEILKLKQYIVSDSTLEKLRAAKVPATALAKLEPLKEKRFRSPVDFRNALRKVFSKRELDRYGTILMEQAIDYRLRNKVQVTFSDRAGNPVQGIFRVCGIYKTTNTSFDQSSVFVNAHALAALYGGNETLTHELAILLNNTKDAATVADKFNQVSAGNSVMTWKELAPDAAMMSDYMLVYYFIFIGIIMLALAFGIINTMLMAILERTKELGMLMAIGMNHRRVFSMIMLETLYLTMAGAVAGMAIGWTLATVLGRTGIHFTSWGEGFEAIGFAAKVYPVVTPAFLLFTALMVFVTAVIASLWPARKALKLNPVEALRTE
jgi:ABC-type lipoprotein release transport system permease subunit